MNTWEKAWLNYDCSKKAETTLEAAKEELSGAGIKNAKLEKVSDDRLGSEGFLLKKCNDVWNICANTDTGLLYGAFDLIRRSRCREETAQEIISCPDKKLRMLNHWDNMDGSIERGYSGKSFFFRDGRIIIDERTRDYARLIASTGINAVVINNVNVRAEAVFLITEQYLGELKNLSELFGIYGIKLFLSLDFAASIDIGGLDSADPLDEKVCAWWKKQMALVYKWIPDFGGFLVKADSEGRPGPFTYGRNQADGANMLAKAIEPYHGLIIWRCFVYNCMQDWRDRKTDRARAAYDYFYDLDGKFMDNVILQIKNGPIDFQVREPFMPLFGKLKKTNYIMEVQIAQEYTGQQIDLCYLIPWFSQLLQAHTFNGSRNDTIGDILARKGEGRGCGIAAVSNTGDDANWTGHDLAAANLYGFGRIAWDGSVSPKETAKEWIKQTFSLTEEKQDTVCSLLMRSWPVYEKYTAPLGVGFMVNPSYHYGPNVDGYEYSRWGTYHYADHLGIGVDRSDKGTGYAMLYEKPVAEIYNDVNKCPDELLLFFHHVSYTHILHSGETVIQHIYNTHFEGAEDAQDMLEAWKSMKGAVDDKIYSRTLDRFERQLLNAREWRDQINSYFYRKTGIDDDKNRRIY